MAGFVCPGVKTLKRWGIRVMSMLFINGCVREPSRTLVLAKHVLSGMCGEVTEVNLNEENITAFNQ